jgi:hypothetical protein
MALLHQVEQAARRGDHEIDAAHERLDLRVLADAAEDHGAAEAEMPAIDLGAVADLHREFAGWRQHQGADVAGAGAALVGGQALQQRQQERGRLAGAGLGDAEQILAGEQRGDGLRLDGGGHGVLRRGQGTTDRLDKVEPVKTIQEGLSFKRMAAPALSGACRGFNHNVSGR